MSEYSINFEALHLPRISSTVCPHTIHLLVLQGVLKSNCRLDTHNHPQHDISDFCQFLSTENVPLDYSIERLLCISQMNTTTKDSGILTLSTDSHACLLSWCTDLCVPKPSRDGDNLLGTVFVMDLEEAPKYFLTLIINVWSMSQQCL